MIYLLAMTYILFVLYLMCNDEVFDALVRLWRRK